MPLRIAVSGGPGAGKTPATRLVARELGGRAAAVPEAAGLLYGGGLPRGDGSDAAREAVQRAIYCVQRELEALAALEHPGAALVCDRGTLDGAAYWPGGAAAFCRGLSTSPEAERARYAAVVFLQTAAVDDDAWRGRDPKRTESRGEALDLDRRLCELWRPHPRFVHVPYEGSMLRTFERVVAEVRRVLGAT